MQREVFEELSNWGAWSRRGAGTGLWYSAVYTQARPGFAVDEDRGAYTEFVLSSWSVVSSRGRRMAFVLKMRFAEARTLEEMIWNYNRRFRAAVDDEWMEWALMEAAYSYWVLSH